MIQVLTLKENKGFSNPVEVFKNIQKINIDYSQENFLVLCLNSRNKLIHSEIMFIGGLNECVVDPKTLFKKALLKNSCAIIVCHNHPSGDLTPSKEDREVFRELKKCGDILNLKVLDSIIFNKKEFYSIADE